MKRRNFGLGLLAAASCGLPARYAHPQSQETGTPPRQPKGWTIPTDEEIRGLLIERIDVKQQGVGIVIGVIDGAGSRIVAHGAYGGADRRSVDGDTVFQIGSVSKAFVTLLLSHMVLRGEVRMDDPAQKHLPPGMRMPLRGKPITLQDLATHMSGLPSMPTNLDLHGLPNPIEAYTVEQWYAFLSSYRLPREPGTKVEYSNQGVALLGHILALRAGKTYEQLVKARILAPLGMNDTSITLSPSQRDRLAAGHDMYREPVESWEMRTMQASGSMRSTARDLLRFLAAHLGYASTPLGAALSFQIHQPRPPGSGTNQSMGLGIFTSLPGSETIYFHDGGKEGYRSLILFNLEARTGVTVLANARSEDNINALGLHLIAGRPLPAPRQAPPLPPDRKTVILPRRLLDAYEGRYHASPERAANVACLGDRLLLDILGDGVSEFFASGEGEYFSKTNDSRLKFSATDGGKASNLMLRESGKEQVFVRV